ncbi:MAG: alpha/beta hydrolase [Flavobacteriales bacterium]|nr:MAG: alpha/beta hydrolase [Flavobacteriales bacterium]
MPKNEPFAIPKSIINTGKFLHFFSSSLAKNFAIKVFSTPPEFKTPEREEMMRKSAKQELIDVPEIGKKIMTYTYGYSKKKVLLVHGWAGRGTQLFAIADKLLENGMMIVSFDAPAHGLSEGKTSSHFDYVAAIHTINKKYGPFYAAVGHSFGGITLLDALSKKHFLDKLVIIGIVASTKEILNDFVKKMQLKPIVAKKMEHYYIKKYNVNFNSISASQTAKKVHIPTLVLHDTEDKDSDVSNAFKVRQSLKNGKIAIFKGLGHRRILREPKILDAIVDFF